MNDIDIYNNSEVILEKKEEKIYVKYIIIVISFIISMVFLMFIKYPKIYYFEGVTNDNEILLLLTHEELKYLKGDKIKINDKEEYYKIDSIVKLDNELNYSNYYSVRIGTKYNYEDNEIIDFTICDGYTTFYNNFLKKIWKGLNNG